MYMRTCNLTDLIHRVLQIQEAILLRVAQVRFSQIRCKNYHDYIKNIYYPQFLMQGQYFFLKATPRKRLSLIMIKLFSLFSGPPYKSFILH